METLKDKIGFEGTLQDLFTFIREDPSNYYEATDVGRQNYLDDNYSYLSLSMKSFHYSLAAYQKRN